MGPAACSAPAAAESPLLPPLSVVVTWSCARCVGVAEEEAPAAAEGLSRVDAEEEAEGGVGDSGEPSATAGEEAATVIDGEDARSVCSEGDFVGVCSDIVGGTEAVAAAGCALDSTATAMD